MTGYIKITATTRDGHEVLDVRTDVQKVSYMDRMQVLYALCNSLKLSLSDLKVFVALKSAGTLDEISKVKTVQDEHDKGSDADLFDQLLHALFGGSYSEG